MREGFTLTLTSSELFRLNVNLEKQTKLAQKIGLKPPTVEVLSSSEKRVHDENIGHSVLKTVHEVRLVPVKLSWDGWTFIASIDHKTGVVVASPLAPEGTVAMYQNVDTTCDHCGTNRERNRTIVVEHLSGERKRVGKACVRKFLDGFPSLTSGIFDLITDDNFFGDADSAGSSYESISPMDFVVVATAFIRRDGFIPSSETRSTKLLVRGFLKRQPGAEVVKISAEDVADAEKIMEWAKSLESSEDFLLNLKASASAPVIGKNEGLLAYLPVAFKKAGVREEKPRVEEVTAPCPSGDEVIEGVILSASVRDTGYGMGWKMLVRDDRGFKVWGTMPQKIRDEINVGEEMNQRVRFMASLTRSDKDESFGFFARPKKPQYLGETARAVA